MATKKLLLTGSSGFIGSHLRRHFSATKADWTVFGIDRRAPTEEFPGQYLDRCNLLDEKNLHEVVRYIEPDAIIHLAAQSRVEPSVRDPLDTYEQNVEASLNVMRVAAKVRVPHLVMCSSETVLGRARTYPTPEGNDFSPDSPYAASKAAVDMLAQQFDRVVPTCVVRSGMGWGQAQKPAEQVVARFIVNALTGEPIVIHGDGTQSRDLNNVLDFCDGVTRILERHARGVYNLSGGKEFSVNEIAKRVVDAVGQGEVQHDMSYSLRGDQREFRTWLDVSKAERDLGHVPTRHFDGPALNDVIEWYRQRRL